MYRRPKIKESVYQSPSSIHLNLNLFKLRKLSNVCGPFPVIMCGRYAGFEKKQWFNPSIAENREFAVYYGYNPRCCFKGFHNKPGSFHYYDRFFYR